MIYSTQDVSEWKPEQKLLVAAFSVCTVAGTLNERNIAVYSDRNHPARAGSGSLPAGLLYMEVDAVNHRIHVAAIDPLTDLANRVLGGFITQQKQPVVREYFPPSAPRMVPDFRPGRTRRIYFNNWEKRLWTLYWLINNMPSPFGDSQLPIVKFHEDYLI